MDGLRVDAVIPTTGRPSLRATAQRLRGLPGRVLVVDDRGDAGGGALGVEDMSGVRVLRGPARGPAAARNAGWRAADAPWVAFLDDDVLPGEDWVAALLEDLRAAAPDAGGTQGRIVVPLPAGRRPTDWERNVAGLQDAAWATADMAYRRAALEAAGGFDERFPRAFREDADLALRVLALGWRLERGRRYVTHPVGPASPWVSLRKQAGNADDALMRRLHGRDWRERAGAPRGRLRRHAAVTAAGLAALVPLPRPLRAAGLVGWIAGTAELAWARIAPGPGTPREIATMLATSAAMPPVAVAHRVAGELRAPRLARRQRAQPPAAVLLDRDGTLVVDVPYNGDPDRVVSMPGARAALDRLRAAGLPLAVVSNQSGVARGLLSQSEVEAVNRRVEELLGPIDGWFVCPHGPDDGCACRKPRPGLVLAAAEALGVEPSRCAMVGDIGTDVDAARAAGARAILVPTPVTRPEEIAAADEVATDLGAAVDVLLAEREVAP